MLYFEIKGYLCYTSVFTETKRLVAKIMDIHQIKYVNEKQSYVYA